MWVIPESAVTASDGGSRWKSSDMFLSCEHDTLPGMASQAFDDVMVAVTAAEMRRALGLLPWPAFETLARARYRTYLAAGGRPDRDPDRGTGRSTRGALLALARCRVGGLDTIHVLGDRHDVRRVKVLASDLGFAVEVIGGDPERLRGRSGGVLFHVDHHEAACRLR